MKHCEAIDILVRKRPEQHAIDNTKDDGGSADAKGEGEDGDDGEAAVLAKIANGVAEIAEKIINVRFPAVIAAGESAGGAGGCLRRGGFGACGHALWRGAKFLGGGVTGGVSEHGCRAPDEASMRILERKLGGEEVGGTAVVNCRVYKTAHVPRRRQGYRQWFRVALARGQPLTRVLRARVARVVPMSCVLVPCCSSFSAPIEMHR